MKVTVEGEPVNSVVPQMEQTKDVKSKHNQEGSQKASPASEPDNDVQEGTSESLSEEQDVSHAEESIEEEPQPKKVSSAGKFSAPAQKRSTENEEVTGEPILLDSLVDKQADDGSITAGFLLLLVTALIASLAVGFFSGGVLVDVLGGVV